MEGVAYNIPTLYTITSKLLYTLSDKVYDIEETGRAKLDKIITIISKARIKATARATDAANNAPIANIIPPPQPANPTAHIQPSGPLPLRASSPP
jgi:hypothetical protein